MGVDLGVGIGFFSAERAGRGCCFAIGAFETGLSNADRTGVATGLAGAGEPQRASTNKSTSLHTMHKHRQHICIHIHIDILELYISK